MLIGRQAEEVEPDQAAGALAVSAFTATLPAAYALSFGLPALLRAAARPGLSWLVPVAVAGPWLLSLPAAARIGPAYVVAPLAGLALVGLALVALLRRQEILE